MHHIFLSDNFGPYLHFSISLSFSVAFSLVCLSSLRLRHEGNTEEKNNGYVVLKKIKYPTD
jgi:hypothetical protein